MQKRRLLFVYCFTKKMQIWVGIAAHSLVERMTYYLIEWLILNSSDSDESEPEDAKPPVRRKPQTKRRSLTKILPAQSSSPSREVKKSFIAIAPDPSSPSIKSKLVTCQTNQQNLRKIHNTKNISTEIRFLLGRHFPGIPPSPEIGHFYSWLLFLLLNLEKLSKHREVLVNCKLSRAISSFLLNFLNLLYGFIPCIVICFI